MKTYDILSTDMAEYPYFVISTSYETPLSNMENISRDLSSFQNEFKIIFDFLLCSGNSTDRFYEAFFDGTELKSTSFKNMNVDKKNKLRKISCEYLKEHSRYLENSVLNSHQIKMLEKGIII